MKHAGVIGGGAWGTALAQVCARAGLEVTLQAREAEVVEAVNSAHENPVFLPGVPLDEAIGATTQMADLGECDLILAVAPAQHLRSALTALSPHARQGLPILLCSKGVEQGSLKLMTQVLEETVPQACPAVLSGPSFAGEVARGLPTAVTLACPDEAFAMELAEAIATPAFRPYVVSDMIGAEAGGAIKNVLAIATGIIEGRGLGRSAHAALITRGFAEMTRMAVALGAEAETVAGLCGLGDLVLTCSSSQSRNMSVGLALGGGQTLEEALAGKLTVAEGVASAPAVRDLARNHGVEMPICEAVAAILAGEHTVEAAIMGLLSRPLKSEGA
ncbi:MAG TPA: NAD(P)H-dependent glycerol-3-phosphate dehydrogenase [Caulobacteraceae bacterium]